MPDTSAKTTAKAALWQQLQLTAAVVAAVNAGQSGAGALEAIDLAQRPGVQALSFHVWRHLGLARALCTALAPKRPSAGVDAMLCTALSLLLPAQPPLYDAHTLVNQAVEAAKRHPAMRRQAAFINACLRRFLREQADLLAAVAQDPVAVWNHPQWWIERLARDHPDQWQHILGAANAQAPMVLRPNVRQFSRPQYLQALADAAMAAYPLGTSGIGLEKAVPVARLPRFDQGAVSVQDAAAQRAAPLLLSHFADTQGLRILDACAAPGGKTGHLLELSDAHVTALDIDAQRCSRIHANLARLGLKARVIAADALAPPAWWDGQLFDAILLDAPCTASGIVRRHPDIRWLRRPSDIEQLAGLQRQLMAAMWTLLRPGGVLLYCTCSVFLAEGQGQVQTFLAHNTDAKALPSPGHLIPQTGIKSGAIPDNPDGDHDGFFYALLQKTPLG